MKRYLCVGINAYSGQELEGCVNDANDWVSALTDRGFVGTILLDRAATQKVILDEIRDGLMATPRGGTFVFQYSGHGTWLPDQDGDEADGRDEALVPVDFHTAGFITDDVLYSLVSQYRQPGSKVLFISDSCFSGSVSRFLAANDHHARFQSGLRDLAEAAARPRFMPPERALSPEMLAVARGVEYAPKNTPSRTGAALLSGCRDDQVSYDAWFGQRANGAFTYAALQALAEDNPQNLKQWNAGIHARIAYDQDPQVSGTWWQRNMTRFL